jgi:hypothetical protein
MKKIVIISVAYFPLALAYKLFGTYEQNELSYIDEYWINSYWFVTAIYFMLIFASLVPLCDIELRLYTQNTIDTYKRVIKVVACYWGVMAALRFYLFFNIELYKKIISSANAWTIGGVTIVLLLMFLTAHIKWRQK